MVADIDSSHAHPVLGWLVDPSRELEEAGFECCRAFPPQQYDKWQWRANDFMEQTRDEERYAANQREGAKDERDAGPSTENKKSIFRKLTSSNNHNKRNVKRVSSTDAVTDEDATNDYNDSPPRNIMPSMVHLQRASSRESVECVLADVFHLPSSSSTLTEEDDDAPVCSSNDSVTTSGTVVIDENALAVEYRRIPCNISLAGTEQTVECVLKKTTSTTSSIMTALDSTSDDEQRIADLEAVEDDAWKERETIKEEHELDQTHHCLEIPCSTSTGISSRVQEPEHVEDVYRQNEANEDVEKGAFLVEAREEAPSEVREEAPLCPVDYSCFDWPLSL